MRIALIAPPWVPVPPLAYGGTEAVIDRLARGFQAAGHEVLLYTTGDSTCPVPREWHLAKSEGMRMGSVVPELRHIIHAYEAVKDFDIIHDHTVMGPTYAERFPSLRVVTTNHGPFNAELIDIYRSISPRVPIIAISRDQAAQAPDLPIARIIHHGIDTPTIPLGKGDGGYFLFLGRMVAEKGPQRAIEVARKAGVPLLLAAKMREPGERFYYQNVVEPMLTDTIRYVGEVGGQEKLDLLAGAIGLLNPIRWHEPFGLVMIEALAAGTPVLAFREGAAPEIVEHGVTGYLCDDIDDMVAAVGNVGSISRAACRLAAEQRFSTERMVNEHLELFASLL